MIFAVNSLKFKTISLNFLEPGHAQMAIENEKRHRNVFSVDEWIDIFVKARSSNPYNVIRLDFDDFYDLKKLSTEIIKQKNTNTEGERVRWGEIRTILICDGQENLVYYNDAGIDEQIKKFNITGKHPSKYQPAIIPRRLNKL